MSARWSASTFHCRRCGARVSAPVEEVLLAEPVFFTADGTANDPRFEPRGSLEPGTLWRAAPEQFGREFDLLVHPDSAVDLAPCGGWMGCCGPAGGDGPNLACPSGHPVATRVADCHTADFVAFSRARVDERPAAAPSAGRVVVIGEPPIVRVQQLVAALHGCLGVTAWHDDDFEALVLDHTTSPGEPVRIYWVDAAASQRAGVPVAMALAAFACARRTHGGLTALIPK
ncbi:hypothetical protein [Nannocystis sp. SCPEA4]|uniref:hypothetical protein n=1 Tax=Nannocystis sp. SCPEA4 TaxID=2996787 RepID=UPI00226DA2F4|nr:hypothetical protein [Nannocystis sp. SCPEA4]MCY1062090.1 hypothetical protein [Nannocystis sp. SCPEA4]